MTLMWHDVVGGIGVLLIVGAYLLLQLGRLSSEGARYSLANALGAILILVSLAFKFNAASVAMEVFWLLISLIGLARWAKRRRA